MKRNNKLLFIVITFFIVVFIILVLSEIVIRADLVLGKKKRKIWIPDPYIGFVHAPDNTFVWENKGDQTFSIEHHTNSFGFLTEEVSIKKPEDVFRVILLGDSFTEALQIEPGLSFAEQLKTLLSGREELKDRKLEVINAGVSGYCPIIQYLLFKRVLYQFEPDLVILQLWTNDFFEDNKIGAMSVLDEQGLPVKINRFFSRLYLDNNSAMIKKRLARIDRWSRFHQWMISKSRFYEYMYTSFVKLNKNSALNKAMRAKPEFNDHNQFFVVQREHSLYQNKEFHRKVLTQSRKYISGLKEMVEDAGADFFMFYIPMEDQLKLKHYGTHSRQYRHGPVDDSINRVLNQFCRETNMRCLDLLGAFEEDKELGLYIDWDGHLNEKGHIVVGKQLAEYIIEKGLLN